MLTPYVHFEIRPNTRTVGAHNVWLIHVDGTEVVVTMNSTRELAEIQLAAFEAAAEAS
jgi:hypothetical protein